MLKLSKPSSNGGMPEGIWGTYSEGVKFKVRKLNQDAITKIRKDFIAVSLEPDSKTGRMVQTEKLKDSTEFDDALTDFILEDFEGVGDEDGNPIPKTLEGKKRIMNELTLRDWIWTFTRSLEIVHNEKMEAEEKNL